MSQGTWAARVDRGDILAMANNLIAIPSTSGEERAVMEWVARWCDQQGLSYEIVARDPDRPNIVITVGDPTSGPVLAMNGHLDTVPVSDPTAWRTGPYDPTLSEDGRKLFGRGSSDMKSSTGVMIYLMGLFKDAKFKGALQAHIVSDEETSATYGTIHLMDEIAAGRLPKPDYCLIGEKSDLKVRNAERGLVAFEVTVY
ncbi:MAG: M20 family metallopeptidase, partial [Thermomicrobiales bacterium]